MSRSSYKFVEEGRVYFLTCTLVDWKPLFSSPDIAAIVLDSIRFLQKNDRLILYGYVLMEHHLHLLASASDLSKEMHDFKSYTGHTIIEYLKQQNMMSLLQQLESSKLAHKKDRTYQVWQEGSHPEMIKDEAMMRQKLDYIHYNPVKKGYVDEPAHWRYSSARNYEGKKGLLEVCIEW